MEERNGRQVGEDDEDWRTGSKERTGWLVVPADDHVPCCLAETACSPSTSVATSLSCMRHVRLTCMAVRSTQAWPGGWIRRTDDGRWPSRRRTTPPCRGRMPAVLSSPLPPAPVSRRLTFGSRTTLSCVTSSALVPCLPSSNQPGTSAPAPSANTQLSEPRAGWVTLPRGFGRFFQPRCYRCYHPDSVLARREGSIDTP